MILFFSIRIRFAIMAFICATGFSNSANAAWLGKDAWEKEDCVEHHSFAWCFVHNMTIRPNNLFQYPDAELNAVQYQEFDAFTAHSELPFDLAMGAAEGVHYGVGAVNGMNAMAHTIQFKLNVVSMLLNATDGVERYAPHFWLVMDKATPVDQQQKEFAAAWQQAIQTVLKFEYTGENLDYGEFKPTFGKAFRNAWAKVKAPGCDDNVICIAALESNYFTALREGKEDQITMPKVSWMGAGEMIRVDARDDLFPLGYWSASSGCSAGILRYNPFKDTECKNSARFHSFSRQDLMQLSKLLPSTVWIWLPLERGNPKAIPALLNNGVAHYFVRQSEVSKTVAVENSKN